MGCCVQDWLCTYHCPVKPDRIILLSADSTTLVLLVDFGFTIATEIHFAIVYGSDITREDTVAQKPQLCGSEQSKLMLNVKQNEPELDDKSLLNKPCLTWSRSVNVQSLALSRSNGVRNRCIMNSGTLEV